GWSEGMALLAPAGLPDAAAAAVIVAGALLDLALGLALLVRRTARAVLLAMLALTALYLVIATVLDTHLWTDPLGRLMKTIPVMCMMLFALAVLDER
ncbi:MAG TPA: DoxX-like family protein, partial [Xanthobacteraceae bacterium]|nr:DoxX-like family protein [Xanthobacteraceae bacterium]